MLKLKLQHSGQLVQRTDPLEKTLILGKTSGKSKRIKGQQTMRWLDGIINSMDMSLSKLWQTEGQGSLACCSPWGCKELDTTSRLNKNHHHPGLGQLCFRPPGANAQAPAVSPAIPLRLDGFHLHARKRRYSCMKGLRYKSEISKQRQIYRESHSQLYLTDNSVSCSQLFLGQQVDLV